MVNLVSIGSLFVDDIVYPDGRTKMGVLGGGAVHAAAGMIVWDERPGLAARVGTGLPDHIFPFLATHFELDGMSPVDFPQVRAWQIFEADGTRRELMRVDIIQPFQDGPSPQSLPTAWQTAKGFYAVLDAPNYLRWRNNYPDVTILWEPNQPYMMRHNAAEFRRTLARVDLVSPNLSEARNIYGFVAPESLVSEMLAGGAKAVALRLGEQGSLVATRDNPAVRHIPAVEVSRVADATGAGNAYCGAFLAGWVKTGDVVQAGRWGSVAASFALESVGLLDLKRDDLKEERDKRLKWLEERSKTAAADQSVS